VSVKDYFLRVCSLDLVALEDLAAELSLLPVAPSKYVTVCGQHKDMIAACHDTRNFFVVARLVIKVHGDGYRKKLVSRRL
jgi:hypothetical protein